MRELARDLGEDGQPDVVVYSLGAGHLLVAAEYRPGGAWAEIGRTCPLEVWPMRARVRAAAAHLSVPAWRLWVVLAAARAEAMPRPMPLPTGQVPDDHHHERERLTEAARGRRRRLRR